MLLLELVGTEVAMVPKRINKAEASLERYCERVMLDVFLGKKIEHGSNRAELQVYIAGR